jgi:hypothetical protein
MPPIDREIAIAEQALGRAHRDLLDRLKSEPAWYALRQLQDRDRRDEPLGAVDPDMLRSRLEGQLDARAAGWRHLGAIEAALAALQPCLGAHPAAAALLDSARGALVGGHVPATSPRRKPGADADRPASILERIRTIAGNRPVQGGRQSEAQLPSESAVPRHTPPPAAHPVEEDRFRKIEAELEQLVRDQPGPLRHSDISPEPDIADDGRGEAEVEIVAPAGGDPTPPSPPVITPATVTSAGRATAEIVTPEAWGDEASVDIVLPDEHRS